MMTWSIGSSRAGFRGYLQQDYQVTGEHATRFWSAKEAVAKARRKGLGANPKRYIITETDGSRLRADGLWVQTDIVGDHMIAWTSITDK